MKKKKRPTTKNQPAKIRIEIKSCREFLHDKNSKKIQHLDSILFLYIVSFAWGDDGICKQSMKKMAEEFKKSRTTIRHSLKRLQKAGYIAHVYRIRKHDEQIIELQDWEEVVRLKEDGNNVVSTWFKIAKKGFKTY